jgi:hypothetical protein
LNQFFSTSFGTCGTTCGGNDWYALDEEVIRSDDNIAMNVR